MLRPANETAPPDPAAENLHRTLHVHPALFAIEYSLAQLWQDWGVRPDLLVGHSMGEYVAACLAGVFSLEDALRLVAIRAKLVDRLPTGAMLAVMLSEQDLGPLLRGDVSISLINGPKLCVVAGSPGAIADVEKRLKEIGALYRPVRNAHAFHSRMLDPIVDEFAEEFRSVSMRPPQVPFISNVTGTWIRPAEAVDPRYWTEHSRRTARFSDALQCLWNRGDPLLIEVGPGRTLGVLASQHPARPSGTRPNIVASLRHDYENVPDAEFILNNLGKVWLTGTEIRWEKVADERQARKVPLPGYPFQRERHWMDPAQHPAKISVSPPTLAGKADLEDWFYVPSW
jgi:acyl transferase domain-containing protein